MTELITHHAIIKRSMATSNHTRVCQFILLANFDYPSVNFLPKYIQCIPMANTQILYVPPYDAKISSLFTTTWGNISIYARYNRNVTARRKSSRYCSHKKFKARDSDMAEREKLWNCVIGFADKHAQRLRNPQLSKVVWSDFAQIFHFNFQSHVWGKIGESVWKYLHTGWK